MRHQNIRRIGLSMEMMGNYKGDSTLQESPTIYEWKCWV